ncbi:MULTISPECIES: hypothetical protein [Pseudanabaena]|jgi:hypothetical protein|uniref:hypothetical protein n=1 Tax=Pseudanabaena TaxID=1152 RepID=UPI00247856A7|nr:MULTISPECIES: hypothetical protein [Pseudanabaena]WGS72892.1 hypothetical protein OA858_02370 [Pseudanabaena galeata CCNP1313]
MQADFLRLQQIYRLDLHYLDVLGGAASPRHLKVVFADKYLSVKTTFYMTNNRELSYFIKIDVESHSFSLRKFLEHYP